MKRSFTRRHFPVFHIPGRGVRIDTTALGISLCIAAVLFMARLNFAQTENTNLSNLAGFDTEPSIAVNPTNSDNIIAGWMRLRLDGRIWIATRASFDGGTTWGNLRFQPHEFSDYGSADVSIVFHRTGIAYLTFVDFKRSPDAGAVFLSSSDDGGSSWTTPQKVIDASERPGLPVDRPWVAIDTGNGPNDGTVYVATMSAFWSSGQHHVYLRSTKDGGANWGPIIQVTDGTFSVGLLKRSYGAISVAGDGKVYMAYLSLDPSASQFLRFYAAVSDDAGSTFQRYVVGNAVLDTTPGFTKGWTIAADPIRPGNAVLCWIDQRDGDLDVFLSRTTDGGRTWSASVRINDDATDSGIAQDLVWSGFSASGKLGVAWRDRRHGGAGPEVPFDIFAAISEDGGASFSQNYRMSTVSSPYSSLECCNSFLGVTISENFLDVNWGDFRDSNWEIYHDRVATGTAVSVASQGPGQPSDFSLSQNYPNPFNPATTIRFSIPRREHVTLKVFDVRGGEVATLLQEQLPSGDHSVIFDARNLTSAVYFYQVTAGPFTQVRKAILMK